MRRGQTARETCPTRAGAHRRPEPLRRRHIVDSAWRWAHGRPSAPTCPAVHRRDSRPATAPSRDRLRSESVRKIALDIVRAARPARSASRPATGPGNPAPACARWSPPPSPRPRAVAAPSGPGPRSGRRTAHRRGAANTPANQVDIESALTANAIRGTDPSPPPISASASASSSAVCAASRSSGTPAGVAGRASPGPPVPGRRAARGP